VERPPDGGKRSFLSLLQDDRINDRYSIARGVSEVIDLTMKFKFNQKQKEELKR
jgi:hypothetical protein